MPLGRLSSVTMIRRNSSPFTVFEKQKYFLTTLFGPPNLNNVFFRSEKSSLISKVSTLNQIYLSKTSPKIKGTLPNYDYLLLTLLTFQFIQQMRRTQAYFTAGVAI
jgi:hypothetical protein